MTATKVTRAGALSLGVPTDLPATLSNDYLSLRFVEHATFGVTLDTMTQHDSVDFAWTNAQSSDDGSVTGQLFRIIADSGSEFDAEFSAEFGAWSTVDPTDTVSTYSGTDPEGHPCLMFRWEGVELPTSGTVDVTAVVSLPDAERAARWSIHVDRQGTAADAIAAVDFPVLAIEAPVPARAGGTHAAAQVRARHLLPAQAMPSLGATNVPLSLWNGEESRTQHPRGYSTIPTQPYQFECICGVDPDPLAAASFRKVLLFGSRDLQGHRKQFYRAGVLAGETLIVRLEHRCFPPWATVPVLDLEDATTRFGNVSHAPYHAILGAIEAPTADWVATAAGLYRSLVAELMPAPLKRFDTSRTDLARGAPWVGIVRQEPDRRPEVVAETISTWIPDLREMTGQDVAYAEVNVLKSTETSITPPMDFTTIRGVNYLPIASTSHCLHLGLVPIVASAGRPTIAGGFFHPSHLTDELDVLESVGFNNIRLWGSLLGYLCDPDGYMASLKTVAQECVARGIGITYIMFNQIPAGLATAGGSAFTFFSAIGDAPATLIGALWTQCNSWQNANEAPANMPPNEQDLTHWPEPLTGAEWLSEGRYGEWENTTFQSKVGQYVQAIAEFFANDSDGAASFHSVDLYNECNLPFYSQGGAETGARELILDFICKVESSMRYIFPNIATTVGWAGDPAGRDSDLPGMTTQLANRGCRLSYSSMHAYNYDATPEQFAAISAVMASAKAEAAALNIPLVFSEFYVRPENTGQMADYVAVMAENSPVGGQSWCYIQNNAYRDSVASGTWNYHGFSYPFDGLVTCRTPMLSILTTDTLVFTDTGGEFSDEFSDEFDRSDGMQADRAAIHAWAAT